MFVFKLKKIKTINQNSDVCGKKPVMVWIHGGGWSMGSVIAWKSKKRHNFALD